MIPNGTPSEFYDVTFRVIHPDDEEKNELLYPRLSADHVLLKPGGKQTVMMHINDKTSKYHLTQTQQELLHNTPDMGGLVVLDKNGHIPIKYVRPTTITLYIEFKTVGDMLLNNEFDEDDYGRLCMVEDCSSDPRIGKQTYPIEWVIYRLIDGTKPHELNSYQIIMTKHDMDRMVHWNDLDHGINSTVEEIDTMVEDSHPHTDREALGYLKDVNGDLYYKGQKIVRRDEIQAVIVTTDPAMTNVFTGDVALLVRKIQEYIEIDESTVKHEEPFLVLEGNQDERYKDNWDIIHGPKLKTTRVTSIKGFFQGAVSLEDYMWYDTRNCTDMSFMNKNTPKLKRIPDLAMDSVENIASFCADSNIEFYGDLIAPVAINANSAFVNCKKLRSVGMIELPLVTNASNLFKMCEELTELKRIELPQAKTVEGFAYGDKSLLSISSFECVRAENAKSAFANCENLISIGKFNLNSCTNMENIFQNCPRLEWVGIAKKSLHTNISFANTHLSIECLRSIIKNLDYTTPYQIDITGTPAANKLTAEDETNVAITGWRLKH